MQDLKFLNSKERRDFLSRLESLYGFRGDLPGHLLLGGKEKVYLLGDSDLIREGKDRELRIDRAGIKIGTESLGGVRLNIEGSQILGPRCSKHVLEIDASHLGPLVKGEDFLLSDDELSQVKDEKGLFLLRLRGDFLGSAVVKDGKLLNHLSKNRRVKNLNN
ncbi:hypothetical protein JW826_03060 [Candidatus Woesearchaeota archaeon]|nr:hypothetical protein [Candidatus Woesearchaeota archaeon]